ncbi:hypothetical protein GCM10010168_27190 [Actinoplanes ianthinogenes]|uniref:Uncharacterized protein n=1 Tax=Actinoplanes ianthinogenes TaxID=122358 RepID=A0ABM7LKS2_9ACTN|nr:hypothetical protein [Actinoplanes ianthinogenes]BCJ39859.1 hypothetical protein Aiant_05160 [Actinoplanes ianthinogenes]GGR08634.1 hypothetical protein GCM10010168_27190 [Actinoplanes ianthinogenes]
MTALSIERLRYYQQQYLGVGDFEAEQEYHRTMRRRHQLGPHTWGIVAGLRLDERLAGGVVEMYLLPGYAVDGFGREVVVGEPVRIDPDPVLFKGVHEPGYVPIWITYDERDTRPPASGYAGCAGGTETTRVTEGWRLLAGPPGETHPDVIVAGLPDRGPADGSVPHQEFPDGTPRWLIRVGAVNWDGQGFAVSDPAQRDGQRPYAGLVAAAVLAPAGVVRIAPRFPVPDPATGRPADVAVVDGPLRVARHATVGNDLLAGGRIGAGTDQPADRLQLGAGLGRIVAGRSYLGFNASRGTGADPPWTFTGDGTANGGAALVAAADGALRVIAKGSTGAADDTVPDSQLRARTGLSVTGTGRVGVGTPDPDPGRALTVRGREPLAFQDPDSGVTAWNVSMPAGGLNVAETGVADGRLFLRAGGNVGVGTTGPTNPLHVPAPTGIRQGNQYLSGRDSWSSLSFNAHHNATNSDWVFPDPDRLAATIEMDAPAGLLGGRFEVWGTTRAAPRTFTNRLHIDLDNGDVLLTPNGGRVGIGPGAPTHPLHVNEVTGIRQGLQTLSGNGDFATRGLNVYRADDLGFAFLDPDRLAVMVTMGAGIGRAPGRFEIAGTTQADPRVPTRRFFIGMEKGETILNGTLGTNNMHPMVGIPNGWGGGLHTWDVYAEGTIATGKNGNEAVTIGSDGVISAGKINTGEINSPNKHFRIPHPARADTDLVHGSVEGPELAVLYRGTAVLGDDGAAEVALPDYFETLTLPEGRTVHLTPVFAEGSRPARLAAGPVEGGRFIAHGGAGQTFHWLVMAVRADVPPLRPEQPRRNP